MPAGSVAALTLIVHAAGVLLLYELELIHEVPVPFNQSPPPVPVVTPIPTQTSAIGDAVAGVAGISGCAAPCAVPVTTAVPPVIFNVSGLPPGLAVTEGIRAALKALAKS